MIIKGRGVTITHVKLMLFLHSGISIDLITTILIFHVHTVFNSIINSLKPVILEYIKVNCSHKLN